MKITETITRFFQGSKGRWVLTAVLVVMLVGIAAYTEFFGAANTQPLISAEGDNNNDPTIIEPGVNGNNIDHLDPGDGQAFRPDPDTQVKEPPAVEAAAAPGSWLSPLSGETGRAHGFSYDTTYNDYRFHHGIDIMSEPGTPVYAAAAGTITVAREDSYWGGIVTIEHGGSWQSTYRCLEPAVEPDAKIAAGDTLGYILESTTNEAAQEAHLHFEMYLNGDEENPADWL